MAPVRSTRGSRDASLSPIPGPTRRGRREVRAVVRQTRIPGENRNRAASGGAARGPALPLRRGQRGPRQPPRSPGRCVPSLLPAPVPRAAACCGRLQPPPPRRGCWPRRPSAVRAAPPRIPLPRCRRAAPSRELTRGERRPRRRALRLPSAASSGAAPPAAPGGRGSQQRPARPAAAGLPAGPGRRRSCWCSGAGGRRRSVAAGAGALLRRAAQGWGFLLRVRLAPVVAGGISGSARALWLLQCKIKSSQQSHEYVIPRSVTSIGAACLAFPPALVCWQCDLGGS